MILKYYLSVLALVVYATSAFASNPVILEQDRDKYPLGLHLEYLVDEKGSLKLADLLSPDRQKRFVPSQTRVLNFGFTESVHWLKFDLVNPQSSPRKVLLEHAYPHMDIVQIFLVRNGIQTGYFHGGDRFAFNHREIDYQNHVFTLVCPPGSTTSVYLRLQTQGAMQLPLTIWEPVAFAEKINKEQMLLGLYFGVMLAMLVYNLFLFIFLRDKNYLYYVLYLASLILVQLGTSRLDVEYLWPDSPEFANLSFPIIYNLAFFFGGLFSRNFLETRKRAPLIDKLICGFMSIAVFGILLTIFAGYNTGFSPVLYILGIFEPLVLLMAGILCWKRGLTIARHYTIAWAALLLSTLVFTLKHLTFLPSTFITDYSLHFGSTFEVIFLSLALGDRINSIKSERIEAQKLAYEAQQRFTNQLESQVKKRTMELEASNQKLEMLSNLDGLTGLFNRRYFDRILQKEWNRLQRRQQPLSLIMADIDHFKQYNDTYGHVAGDSCIRTVAESIRQSLRRASDVAVRYGGEEFVLILPEIDSKGAQYIAQTISDKIRKQAIPHKTGGTARIVALSIGIATMIPDDESDVEALITASDSALYKSKTAGRDRITVNA